VSTARARCDAAAAVATVRSRLWDEDGASDRRAAATITDRRRRARLQTPHTAYTYTVLFTVSQKAATLTTAVTKSHSKHVLRARKVRNFW